MSAKRAQVVMDSDTEAHVYCGKCPDLDLEFFISYTSESGFGEDEEVSEALDEAGEALVEHLRTVHGVEVQGPLVTYEFND